MPSFTLPSPRSPFLLALSEQRLGDERRVGHLGMELGELARSGLPIPDGFVISAQAYLYAMDCAGARRALHAGCSGVSELGPLQLAAASTKLQGLVRTAGMPDEMRDAIRAACRELRASRVMVRASEVGGGAQPAARTRRASYLNVSSDQLCDAIVRCWSTSFSQQALRDRPDGAPEPEIAVVVQRMLDCEKAGLLYTAEPRTGDPTLAVIDGADTDGAVLGARIDPNTYVIDKRERRVVARGCARASGAFLETERQLLPHERPTRVLDDAELASLADLARTLDALYGAPRTVEWALSRQHLYVVASMPPAAPPPIT